MIQGGKVGTLANLKADCKYIFLNGVVNRIPIWNVRAMFYKLMGMKIGKGSRILLGTRVMNPANIVIGERTIVNEDCLLDGRGGLIIGNDVSISIQSMILTDSHDAYSSNFKYVTSEVVIEDNSWLCARSLILPGAQINKAAIIAAGCVFRGVAENSDIYGGVPAKKIGERNGVFRYRVDWTPPLRKGE